MAERRAMSSCSAYVKNDQVCSNLEQLKYDRILHWWAIVQPPFFFFFENFDFNCANSNVYYDNIDISTSKRLMAP